MSDPFSVRRSSIPVPQASAALRLLQSAKERSRPPEIRRRLIATLFGRASNVLMVALAALICGSAAWVRGGNWMTAAIAAGEIVMLLFRCGVIIAFQRQQRRTGLPQDTDRWLVAFGFLAIGSSMSWGALCFVCLATSHDPVLYVIPVLSTVGTAGAVAARNSGVPRLAKIQLAASLSPILAGCWLADDIGYCLLLLLVPAMAAGLLILINERNQQLVELIETQSELAKLSMTDALTQVPNRRFLDLRLEEATDRALRASAASALLMIDVDNFKAFNDRHGHIAGDALLREIAALLKGQLRTERDVVARYGGEEFAILLDEATLAQAVSIGERLRQIVAAQCRTGEGQPVTISIGIAACTPTMQRETLVDAADAALYRAKRAGRNRIETAASLAAAA